MEKLSIGWVSGGSVKSKFAFSVSAICINPPHGIKINKVITFQSSVIAVNRQSLIDEFWRSDDADWLLLLDSDIVISPEDLFTLWNAKDKEERPVVLGTYFLLGVPSGSHPLNPMPALFGEWNKEINQSQFIHPLPYNKLIRVYRAGLGCTLLHRSVIDKLKEKYGNDNLFAEDYTVKPNIGEDFSFFAKVEECGIPVYAHTGVDLIHEKTINLTREYYDLFWGRNVQQ